MATFEARPYEEIVESLLTAMTTSPSPLTDRSVGSVTRTLAESLGWEIAYLHRQLARVYLSGFVDTAEGDSLDRVVALVGVTRYRQETASGQVTFYRKAGVAGEILIPAGTRVSAEEPPVAFETTDPLRLGESEPSGTVQVHALVDGAEGVLPPGAIAVINRPLAGIDRVENREGTALSGRVETDAQLRERARRALERAGRATANAIRYGLLEVPGVEGVVVTEDPVEEPGIIRVIVDCPAHVRSSALAALDDLRAAGVRVIHNLDENPAGAIQKVALSVKLYLTFDRDALPSEEKARAREQIEAAVRAYLGGLKLGDAASVNRLVALALAVPGVGNAEVALTTDPGRQIEPDGRLPAAPHEKFELKQVELAPGRTLVYLDVRVKARVKPGLGITAEQVTDEIRRGLESRLEQAGNATRQGPVELTAVGLLTPDSPSPLYQVQQVRLNLTVPERFLTLRDVETVSLAERDVPRLRTLDVQVEEGGL